MTRCKQHGGFFNEDLLSWYVTFQKLANWDDVNDEQILIVKIRLLAPKRLSRKLFVLKTRDSGFSAIPQLSVHPAVLSGQEGHTFSTNIYLQAILLLMEIIKKRIYSFLHVIVYAL